MELFAWCVNGVMGKEFCGMWVIAGTLSPAPFLAVALVLIHKPPAGELPLRYREGGLRYVGDLENAVPSPAPFSQRY